MNALSFVRFVGAITIFISKMSAATLLYQPSPYKGTDVWVTNYYSYGDDYGVNDNRLIVGGWGDTYMSALKFDLEGLPKNVTQAIVALYPYAANNGSKMVGMNVFRLTNTWTENSGWYDTSWTGVSAGSLIAPQNYGLYSFTATGLYDFWKSNPSLNQGLMLVPQGTVNQYNYFYSSDYSQKPYRPFIYLVYDETVTPPNFKLPLPGGRSWVVTTEIGGKDAFHPNPTDPEYFDTAHNGENYFSIDLAASSSPQYYGDIPIYAAAGGRVILSTYTVYNGYHVVIDHDYDGRENTGFTTRYLHFKNLPLVSVGQNVTQGQILGYMGDTGASKGAHLHFGVRYNGSGASSVNELAFVKLEGLPLKQYQTEVDGNGNRNLNSYFPSTNTP
jgi:murein DD-endopeptidase MepM/ murein hydrolase activator NlpD